MNNPKVSVIIPVYNTEAYVEQTLRSIMGQTLRDIELIVINDGSTDGSLSALERIATGDDRIRLYTQPNKGLSQTRNAGIDRARGEFIYFMDSDDLLEPDALERCYERCQSGRRPPTPHGSTTGVQNISERRSATAPTCCAGCSHCTATGLRPA